MLNRRITIMAILLVLVMALFFNLCVSAQTIDFIVGASAGGGTDTAARVTTNQIEKNDFLDEQIVILNRPGGTGAVAMEIVTGNPADGKTITMATTSWAMTWATNDKFGPEDFQAVIRLQSDPRLWVIRADDDRFQSWEEVVEYAKNNPNKPLSVGGGIALGQDSWVVEQSSSEMGIPLNYVPFGSTGPAVTALLGGHVDLVTGSIGSFLGQMEAGEIKLVLALTEDRLPPFPEVPTATELGYNVLATLSRGVLVKAGTPAEEVKKLHDAFKAALETDEYKEWAEKNYLNLENGYRSSEEFQKEMEDMTSMFEKVLAD